MGLEGEQMENEKKGQGVFHDIVIMFHLKISIVQIRENL